ncbi:hypothetical protein KRE40_03435 [Elizabethkingia meningoseptica]|uniref:Uncharacterized protein n=2 Tax=Weeksellaceae TaxID=2762318 RepID=A0A1V3TWY3_ELIME|nr:hypothetical protein BBD33_07100 [Elizabethkingia meningoseptica]AQX12486.1 hypothetical protein BBD35_08930 [Elizabethkingia meningoseptica]AQX47069.1 hypothetical protein B5G46_07090 [Elizabethkingia meningoseptica]EJK5329473.1 hypothetical protein [Elizabethkingia meningoseptica]KUY17957.1 hypothetical protein ATB99_06805 [Elizabethkingia meningoseptica]
MKKKKDYMSPSFTVITVEMEQGIAASSATLGPGTTTPPITEWENPGSEGDFGTGIIEVDL